MDKLSEIKAKAGSLSLTHTKGNMELILKNAESANATYLEFLSDILQEEINYRHDKAKSKRIKEAGFPYIKKLDDFDLGFCKSLTEKQFKQLSELFMDTGIGREGYSFIGQGRVEDILSPNSDVRRQVFEEASGIVKYKTRKEESERKLEKTKANLERTEDIIAELRERIDPLYEQSVKAQKFIEIRDKLKKYELNYLCHEYEKHTKQLEGLKNQRDLALEEKLRLQKRRDNYTEIIEDLKEKIKELENAINKTEKIRESKNKELEDCNRLIQVHKEKELLYGSNIENIKNEIRSLENRNLDLTETVNTLIREKSSLEETCKIDKEKYEVMDSNIKEYKKEIDEISLLIEKQKNELFELHKDVNKINSEKNTIDSLIANNTERIRHLFNEVKTNKRGSI